MLHVVRLHMHRTCGLVVMTSASHAEGRQFDPGQVYSWYKRNDRNSACLAWLEKQLATLQGHLQQFHSDFIGKPVLQSQSTPKGCEPLRAKPNGFLVHHRSHSVTVSMKS